MIQITIDGKKLEVAEGTILIEAMRQLGIDVPSLCDHEAITPDSSNGCSVEVKQGTETKIVTACNYPIRSEMEVSTDNERVIPLRQLLRKMLFNMVYTSSPKISMLQKLAAMYTKTAEKRTPDEDDCILCGKCVKVCGQVKVMGAIDTSGGAVEELWGTPYGESSHVCIGCGACDFSCPKRCVGMNDQEGKRFFKKWNNEHELHLCNECGAPIAARAHIDFLKKRFHFEESIFDTCTQCKRKHYASRVASEGHM